MSPIQKDLFTLQDLEYKAFNARLIPTIKKETIIGNRVPVLRKYAKNNQLNEDFNLFISSLPHVYFEENMLHAIIISSMNEFEKVIYNIDRFLPFVDNWAVCDTLSPKIMIKHRDKLIHHLDKWLNSKHNYTQRFGIKMLMEHYLDDDFNVEFFDKVISIKSDDYYVKMMISWYFATALVKQSNHAMKVIEENLLDHWTHNKTIQKAIESYRISSTNKEILKKYKRK
ncbi:DNA alkylation repair protein [Acholeplasma granularum]|uniref:DNA alkylation repair protein n=1 Tax=Acholeplasma granularum TaxID=264635 RepID=UPI0004710590|nr:DNA alkylation repair protein [Acholeplasma granularum]